VDRCDYKLYERASYTCEQNRAFVFPPWNLRIDSFCEMSVRFHKVNEVARQKKKQIPEKTWKKYEPYIEKEWREGKSLRDIARAVERNSQGNFVPKYVPSSVQKPTSPRLIALVAVSYGTGLKSSNRNPIKRRPNMATIKILHRELFTVRVL
jgi:hypothetical protein